MKPTRIFVIVLLLIFVLLLYKLLFSDNSISQAWRLKGQLTAMNAENALLQQRNSSVTAEVANLKKGDDAVEERARSDLGLVKPDEVFYQIVP
jgi:cell division protein FtsB